MARYLEDLPPKRVDVSGKLLSSLNRKTRETSSGPVRKGEVKSALLLTGLFGRIDMFGLISPEATVECGNVN